MAEGTFLSLVNAWYGRSHQCTSKAEKELQEIFVFFDKCRVKQLTADVAPPVQQDTTEATKGKKERVYSMPGKFRDWYTARISGFRAIEFKFDQEDVDRVLSEYLKKLCDWSMPTVLVEPLPLQLHKLFFSVEAYVGDVPEPPECDTEPWRKYLKNLKDTFLDHVLKAVSHIVRDTFNEPKNLVVVFDASGWSWTACRWKLSLRLNWGEIAVAVDTARRQRETIVNFLESSPQPDWISKLEGIDHKEPANVDKRQNTRHDGYDAPAAKEGPKKFWNKIFDFRCFQKWSLARLVFCDAFDEDDQAQRRPLMPYNFFHVTAEPLPPNGSGEVIVRREQKNFTAAQWIQLGSLKTHLKAPTAFWNHKLHAKQPVLFASGAAPRAITSAIAPPAMKVPLLGTRELTSSAAKLPSSSNVPSSAAPAASGVSGSDTGWWEHKDDQGIPYYYCTATGQRTWTRPEGVTVRQYQGKAGKANAASSTKAPSTDQNGWQDVSEPPESRNGLHNHGGYGWQGSSESPDSRNGVQNHGGYGLAASAEQSPQAPAAESPSPDASAQPQDNIWYKAVDSKGRTYYYKVDNTVSWELPPGATLLES